MQLTAIPDGRLSEDVRAARGHAAVDAGSITRKAASRRCSARRALPSRSNSRMRAYVVNSCVNCSYSPTSCTNPSDGVHLEDGWVSGQLCGGLQRASRVRCFGWPRTCPHQFAGADSHLMTSRLLRTSWPVREWRPCINVLWLTALICLWSALGATLVHAEERNFWPFTFGSDVIDDYVDQRATALAINRLTERAILEIVDEDGKKRRVEVSLDTLDPHDRDVLPIVPVRSSRQAAARVEPTYEPYRPYDAIPVHFYRDAAGIIWPTVLNPQTAPRIMAAYQPALDAAKAEERATRDTFVALAFWYAGARVPGQGQNQNAADSASAVRTPSRAPVAATTRPVANAVRAPPPAPPPATSATSATASGWVGPVPAVSRMAVSSRTTVAAVSATAASAAAVCKSSPQALTRALQKAGFSQPAGSAVHHIVARNAANAEPARKVLQHFGVHLDDAANGVFLPATRKVVNPTGAAVHSTVHTKAHYEAVNDLLELATSRAEVEATLLQIRQKLLAGGL